MSDSKFAYFDEAATSYPKPEVVYDFMDKFYRTSGFNLGRGSYSAVENAAVLQRETRDLLLKLFHCEGKNVFFEPSATISLNQVIRGINWHDGDVVYISPFEHNAVLRPLNYLKQQYNLKIIELSVDRDTISYNLEKIKYQFQEAKPNVVIVSHASNVCGVVAPIEKIFPLAKFYQATTIVDMSQTAGLIDTNLIEAMADFAIFAGHKTLYGPFGIAGFVATSNIALNPLIYGGTGIESANPFMPDQLPIKYEAGSQNILAIAGLNAALKWIFETGIKEIYRKDQKNLHNLLDVFKERQNIKTIIPKENKIGLISFTVANYSSDSLSPFFSENGIACRTGLQCSPEAHKFLGTFPEGTVRFSCGFFTKESDFHLIKQVVDQLDSDL